MQVNEYSFCYIVSALRAALPPAKLITFFYIGDATRYHSYGSIHISEMIDMAFHPYYDGSFMPPPIAGMSTARLSGAAFCLTSNTEDQARYLAEQTIEQQCGVFMCYDLTEDSTRAVELLSSASRVLYGSDCKYVASSSAAAAVHS